VSGRRVVAFTACTSPFTSALTDGTKTFRVRGTIRCERGTPGDVHVALDTVAPTVSLSAVPAAPRTTTRRRRRSRRQCRHDQRRVDAGFAACTCRYRGRPPMGCTRSPWRD
jgi:hypothetical protein